MTKQPKQKTKKTGTDMVVRKTEIEAPTYGPGVLEVVIYTIGTGDNPIYGHVTQDNLFITEKAVLVHWIDGGHTFVPMDAIDRIHWEPVTQH